MNDSELKEAAVSMEKKVAIFNLLRKAMRITLPENKRGLNDNGDLPCTMKTVKKEVGKFETWLSRATGYSDNNEYKKLLEQINTYQDKLFTDPITVTTAAGKMLVRPQITNNILEQFFRRLMGGYRKKNGFNSVERVIRAMLPDTPLTMNLKNENSMQIILAGKRTLEERFAEIDSKNILSGLEASRIEIVTIHPGIKKIIRISNLPETLVLLLEKAAS